MVQPEPSPSSRPASGQPNIYGCYGWYRQTAGVVAGGAASDMWGEVSDHAGQQQSAPAHPDHPAGAISPEVWPSVESLDLYNRVEIQRNIKRWIKERLKPDVINRVF